ncbi:MAG: hypothetical protein L6R42_000037 [Xanthoria sp. 1 TBL-2021]|nr:MAG: hypothetical protein L6R42_000037 [Xanthoria sp. 1 TBL-2021]
MAPNPRLAQFCRLDEHDIDAEREAEAQRTDFERQLTSTKESSSQNGTTPRRQNDNRGNRYSNVRSSSNDFTAVAPAVAAQQSTARRNINGDPNTDTPLKLADLDTSSSDERLSEPPSDLSDDSLNSTGRIGSAAASIAPSGLVNGTGGTTASTEPFVRRRRPRARWDHVVQALWGAWLWIRHPPTPASIRTLYRIFRKPIHWALKHIWTGLMTFLVFLAIILAALVLLTNVGTVFRNAADNVMTKTCQVYSLGWICSLCCGSPSFLSLYVLSKTCAYYPTQGPLKIEGGTYWEAEVDFNDSDNIPRQLSDYLNRCSFYEDKVRRHRHAFSVSEEHRKLFLDYQLGICAVLSNITSHLPAFYRHAFSFSDSLIYELNITQLYMENSVNDTSRDAVVEQQRINQKIPEIAATWQKRYQRFKDPGIYMEQEIKSATTLANSYMELIQHAQSECGKARTAKKKQWPIARRIGRAIGLFRVPPEDLYELDDAARELGPLFNEVGGLHKIFSLVGSNVTKVNTALGDLAENKLNADIRFQLGPGGREKLQDYMDGFQVEAQGVRRTIGNARIIKRGKSDEQAATEPAGGEDDAEETEFKE